MVMVMMCFGGGRVAAGLGAEQRQRMRECFVQTSKFEFMFWDMAHSKQVYPI
jgi:thiaminase